MASLYAMAYNGTEPTGGNSLTSNLNQYYEVGYYIALENYLNSMGATNSRHYRVEIWHG
jgi:hypothetical protein